MKILILSCGTGGGHNSACMALKKQMENRGHDVETLNPYMLKGRRTAATIDHAYVAMAQKIPRRLAPFINWAIPTVVFR